MALVKKSVKENVTKLKVLPCRGWPLSQATRPAFFRRLDLNKREVLLAAALAALVAEPSAAVAAGDKEKCYGIAKAGQNDCASLNGSHSCAGQGKTDKNADEWKYVAKGTCKQAGGMTAEEAKKKTTK